MDSDATGGCQVRRTSERQLSRGRRLSTDAPRQQMSYFYWVSLAELLDSVSVDRRCASGH
jgi:hypothetical protein